MTTEYKTYDKIREDIKNGTGFAGTIPLTAASTPYNLYECDAEAGQCGRYYGLSPRTIKKLGL